MKLFVNLARAVVDALELIFEQNKYADKVIEKVLKQNNLENLTKLSNLLAFKLLIPCIKHLFILLYELLLY